MCPGKKHNNVQFCDMKLDYLGYELMKNEYRSKMFIQPTDIGWPTGNGNNLSNSQACCLTQLCLAAA